MPDRGSALRRPGALGIAAGPGLDPAGQGRRVAGAHRLGQDGGGDEAVLAAHREPLERVQRAAPAGPERLLGIAEARVPSDDPRAHLDPVEGVAAGHFAALGAEDPEARAQSLWSLGQTVTGLAIALSAPLLGALADTAGRRTLWVAGFSVLYVAGTAGLWWLHPDGGFLWGALILFGVAMVGAEFATIFTNAILPSLGPPERIGRVSGSGFALGYAGGVGALLVMLLLFAEGETGRTVLGNPPALGLDPVAREGTRLVGPFTAAWYALFMVPFFLYVREPATTGRASLARAWSGLRATVVGALGRPSLLAFLGGSMLYRDALVALYAFGGVYARLVLGWEVTQIGVFGIVGAVTAALATWAGGRLDARFGPKPVVTACILILTAVCAVLVGMDRTGLYGFAFAPDSQAPDILFYGLGALIGGAGGVLQAASRTLMVLHAGDRPTEAFGLYALSGKATAFLAPALIGLATYASGSPRFGLFPLIPLFLAGLALLVMVRPYGDRA